MDFLKTQILIRDRKEQEQMESLGLEGSAEQEIQNALLNLNEIAFVFPNTIDFNGTEIPSSDVELKNGESWQILTPFNELVEIIKEISFKVHEKPIHRKPDEAKEA